MSGYERFEVPPGVEAALHRLASAVEKDGFAACKALVRGGRFDGALLTDRDGSQHYVSLIDGEWYELGGIDG